ncbi:MAG: SPOR domain-containing protein [Candidatus Omnitrophica bacterium]|nr:SPOR domain-containing protein [Candidatus Omnitrophota bacterium]
MERTIIDKMLKRAFFIILFLLLCRAGIVNASLVEVETSFLKGDYEKVKAIADADMADATIDKANLAKIKYFLALSHLWLKEYSDAKKVLEALHEEDLDKNFRDKVSLGIIDACYLNDEYETALDTAQRFIKENASSDYLSLVYLKLARINLKLAQWAEAEVYLKKVINDFPQSMDVYIAKQLLEENRYFAVQVGSFALSSRAEQLAQELKEKGEYAYVVEITDQENKKYYRVRVGKLSSLSEAKHLKSKLSELGYPTSIYP